MRFLLQLFSAVCFCAGVQAVQGTPVYKRVEAVHYESKKFILEAQSGSGLSILRQRIEDNGGIVRKVFDSELFSGLSIETDSDNIDSLQEVAEVAHAWPVNRFYLLPIQEDQYLSEENAAANWSVHWSTGVDKAHEAGLYGKGATIAIIDSGIDYNHEALGGGFGQGFKVAGGYDLVGQEYNGSNEKIPDEDPMDSLGHGTHVAGIIGGNAEGFTGVAPEATILAYKVFGAVDGTDEDSLIDATLMAYEAGADVITASIGRASGFADGPWATVCSRVVDAGVVVTVAAGNDGETGPFYASSGSSGRNVLAVASVTTGLLPAQPWHATFTIGDDSTTTQLGYIPSANRPLWNVTGLPVIPISLNTSVTNDACTLPDTTPDLTNAVALVRKGTCNVYTKQANLEKFGARWVLLYNDEARPFATVINTRERTSEMVMIDSKAGAAIVEAVANGGRVVVDFTIPENEYWRVGFYDSAGGIPSDYSSWGGTNELEIKPDIAAPGSQIWSTYLNNSFRTLSGTSMACPYVAGVAALYIGKYGGRANHGVDFAKRLTERIITSGRSLPWQVLQPTGAPQDFGVLAPVPQVGGGLINATKVLEYTTKLEFDRFALNDTSHFSRYQKVKITNDGDREVIYTFGVEPAGGFDARGRSAGLLGNILDTRPRSLVPTVTFPSGVFRVRAGETREAQFNFMYPKVEDESRMPIYSGKILIQGNNGEDLSIPYFGAAFDLKKTLRGNMAAPGYPLARSGPRGESIEAYHKFAFNVSAQDFPKVYTQYQWGVKELRWDIFDSTYRESQWKYPPVVGENGYVGSATYSPYASSQLNFNNLTMDRNRVLPFPMTNLERTGSYEATTRRIWWLGQLANGSYIAPGFYHMRFAARLPFSNPNNSDNWDIWDTPTIEVLPVVL
ncbi:subtilisin-like serine protease [Stachybotrys elegans]|uniref:Subtilisin-like serine protease n=1 Tax=Stachybotrys elegans TaxID=80388 RepID=A0A8K0SMY1_9HYPO|nr:subtilisin-like serine protease [Stachybotrys elegans]